MELEEQEGFNNNHNYHSKPYKSSSTKKYHGERSPVYNLNVPLSEKNIFPFINSFDKTKSYETQLEFMNALLRASHDTMEKFAELSGISILDRNLRDSSRCLSSRIDLVDRILSYLNKINLTPDMLTRSRIHQGLELIKACPDITEELSNKTFKLLIKWREVIKQWQEDDGESKALQYEIDQEAKRRASRSFIKRTNGHDRSSGSVSSEDGDRNNSRKPRERDNYKMSRGGGSRGRYDRGGFYNKNQNRRRPYDDDYLDDDDDDVDKKNVKWIEDDNLVRFKFFRFNDEPSHRGLTEDEVTQIQEKLFDEKAGLAHLSSEDLKHQESRMENNSFKIKKDNEAEIQSKLNEMKEEIEYYRPKKLLIEENAVEYGKGSTESIEHGNRIHNKLPCFYLRDKIPDQPSFENIRNTQKSTSTGAIIPLSNSTSEKGIEGEESEGLFDALEEFAQKGQIESSSIGGMKPTTTEIQSSKKMEEIQIEVKKPTQVAPRKGILKKSRDQLLQEKEEARKLEEEKQKQKDKQKKGMSLDSDLVMKLVNGEMTQEEQENLVNTLKESGDAEGLLQNIATLKQFMNNVSHTKVKKGPKYDNRGGPNPNHPNPNNPYYGQEPKKMVKLGSEHPQPNLVPAGRGPVEEEKQPSSYPSHFQEEHDDYRNQQGQGGQSQFDRQKGGPRGGKAPFKPTNYKTVPCVWFHSAKGCPYGDSCNFIHDPNHAGRQTPNMHKYVRPIDQIDKNGPDGNPGQGLTPTPTPTLQTHQTHQTHQTPHNPQNPNPRGGYPSQSFNPKMPQNTNPPPTSYYGFPDRNTSGGNMNIEKTPQVPYGTGPPNTFTRNPPSHNYMHSNQNANINSMPYNNRMGGGHHTSNYQHHGQQSQSNYGGYHSHATPHGGHPGHQSHYNPQGHHMMMPPDQGGYRNDMMYQGGNPRMPPTGHHPMQMPMGYNPNMMPPKNVMPPTGGGYGMMDYNKGKE